jgi:beta-mannosidase
MKELNLGGTWQVHSSDSRYKFEQTVPGSVFQTLEESGAYGEHNVFYRDNNRQCLEMADRDFVFDREFTMDQSMLAMDKVYLEADGLDTLTTISLNGTLLAKTENMHRTYRFEMKSLLKEGKNSIRIIFHNTLEFLKKEQERRKIFSADNGGITSVEGFNMIRKSHCSYGWDWGPMIPDVGIWRDIYIRGYRNCHLESVHVTQVHEENKVTLNLDPEAEIWGETPELSVTLTSPEGQTWETTIKADERGSLVIENPQLWWPNGLGEQPLYKLVCSLADGQRKSMKIGLRTMTVLREKDQWGESFAFAVNGLPLFARGGDYIPEDVYLTRVTREKTERLIKDAVEANFNSIRVWGGGVYPSNDFFDLCDEYGLVNWQDMMFACAIYDVNNEDFLDNITHEVRDNLKRIRHHASIGLICGNNEMEWGVQGWFKATGEEKTEYLKQYEFIFPQIAKDVCPELFYWPSSPSSGGNFEDSNSADRGDCHFWDVWHGLKPFSEYEKHYFRFMSEFGFESYPDMKTIKSFTEEGDRNPFSHVMDDHQRCPGGNSKIFYYMSQYFKAPGNLENSVYLSQLSQGDALCTGIKHWRRNRGRCMGAVYWQLNDNWPVASWSSIDYYGRWKALHYMAKRSFENLLLSCEGEGGSISLWLSNEDREEQAGTLEWQLNDFDGKVVSKGSEKAVIAPFTSKIVLSMDFSDEISGANRRNRFLTTTFTTDQGYVFHDSHAFCEYKHMELNDPELKWSIEERSGKLAVKVKTKKPALFIKLDLEGDGIFTDNFFDMAGSTERVIGIIDRPETSGLTKEMLEKQLTITSLYESSY